MLAAKSAPAVLEVLEYVVRFASIVTGLILVLGAVWFAGSVSTWLELGAGISGIIAALMPTRSVRTALAFWPWLVLVPIATANALLTAWGVWHGIYAGVVVKWALSNVLCVWLLFLFARMSKGNRDRR
jgi:hypothetical protein